MEELNIKELFYQLWKKKFFIIIIVVVGIAVGMLYSSFVVKPLYKSVTTLVLSKATQDNGSISSGSITQTDVTLNQKLVSTYSEIMKSRTVAKQVIEKLKLNLTEEELIGKINVQSKKDTELLEISISNEDPKIASDIANTLAEVFTDKVKEVYKIENVSIIDKAEISIKPYNINLTKTVAIFAIGALFVACFVVFVGVYFNNTIKSPEEVEKLLGLPVLAVIPKYKA
ncbi:MAG: Wzz/FepE/Etk N-terminal domain-containing protein [Clostridia bacterium]|nr:Wzz/FepE/Etk N-terminal domain-containing protein [Clostridia bacterium]